MSERSIMQAVAKTALSRTKEGWLAMNSVAEKTVARPQRFALLGAGAVNVVSSLFGWEKPRKVSKTILMPLLAADVWADRHHRDQTTTAALVAGLAAGWVGDLLLMPKNSSLNPGSAAFAVNHGVYSALLWRAGARPAWARVAARLPLLAGSLALTAAKLPKALPAVLGYGPVLASTSVLGDDRALVQGKEPGDLAYGIGHGGNLFLISDGLLILNRVVGDDTKLGRLLDAAVMDSYIVAQIFLSDGIGSLGESGVAGRSESAAGAESSGA